MEAVQHCDSGALEVELRFGLARKNVRESDRSSGYLYASLSRLECAQAIRTETPDSSVVTDLLADSAALHHAAVRAGAGGDVRFSHSETDADVAKRHLLAYRQVSEIVALGKAEVDCYRLGDFGDALDELLERLT